MARLRAVGTLWISPDILPFLGSALMPSSAEPDWAQEAEGQHSALGRARAFPSLGVLHTRAAQRDLQPIYLYLEQLQVLLEVKITDLIPQ